MVRRLPWWGALVAAAAGGLLLDTASPALDWWWAAFPAVALVLAALWQQRARFGMLVGLVAGIAFWMPHISWLTLYLGPVPWLGLCAVMVLWWVLFGVAAAVATRGLSRIARPGSRRWLVILSQSLAVSGLWVLREQVQGAWPYGGFAWGRVAHTQADGPLAQAVSWIGFAGFTGVLVLVCAIVVAALYAGSLPRTDAGERAWTHMWVPALVSFAIVIALSVIPAATLPQRDSLRVAAIQGNSKSAIFDDRESGAVLEDHVEATEQLLDQLEESGESVDVIVWPENSGEFDLRDNVLGGFNVAKLAQRAKAPIVVGSILKNADGTYTNSSLVWYANGESDTRYDKRFPVPFAEYMPNRDFFHALAPDLVDLVRLEYSAGTLSPVIDIALRSDGRETSAEVEPGIGDTDPESEGATDKAVRAGLAICFDIIFDAQAVSMVDDGAEVIFAQTNNADFGRTDESAQQLAIARLRAIETGRTLVNISTVGTSAIVAPDGHDIDRLEPFTADSMVAEAALVTGQTPALRIGAMVAWAWVLCGAAGTVVGATVMLRRPLRGTSP